MDTTSTPVNRPLTKLEQDLVANNIPLITWAVNKWTKQMPLLKSTDYDDRMSVAYEAAVRAAKTYDPEKGKWSNWLLQSMRGYLQLFLNREKKHWGKLSFSEPNEDFKRESELADPNVVRSDDEVGANEQQSLLKKQVADALQFLPVEQRIVIRLHVLEEKTMDHVAEFLDISKDDVKLLKIKAFWKLSQLLRSVVQ